MLVLVEGDLLCAFVLLSPDLQETVNSLLEEKKQFTCQLQDQRRQIEELTARVSVTLLPITEREKTWRLAAGPRLGGWVLDISLPFLSLFLCNG